MAIELSPDVRAFLRWLGSQSDGLCAIEDLPDRYRHNNLLSDADDERLIEFCYRERVEVVNVAGDTESTYHCEHPSDEDREVDIVWYLTNDVRRNAAGPERWHVHLARKGMKWLRELETPSQEPKRKKLRHKHHRASSTANLTAKQTEAVHIVGECNGNFAQAARQLGKDRKTVKQSYIEAMTKLGKLAVSKPATQQLPTDRRGQENVSREEDRRL